MAKVKCHSCGDDYGSLSKVCPWCKAPNLNYNASEVAAYESKQIKEAISVLLPVAGIAVAAIAIGTTWWKGAAEKAREAQREFDSLPIHTQLIKTKRASMTWRCEEGIKAKLKDPDSYRTADSYLYKGSKDNESEMVRAEISYRAKNSFGGYVMGDATCGFDYQGRLLYSTVR